MMQLSSEGILYIEGICGKKPLVSFMVKEGRLSLYWSQVAHPVGDYPGFLSMTQLGVSLLPPGWDASPVQSYPPAFHHTSLSTLNSTQSFSSQF